MNKILNMQQSVTPQASATDLGSLTKVIAITSGKGGVGKTNITSNLGIELAARGARVCIFDADTSLANINVLMGLTPQYTIEDILSGEKNIDDIIIDGPKGIKIVPAASGIAECATLSKDQQQTLITALIELEKRFDYILIDTAAGIGDNVLSFIKSAQYTIVVISPEPTSLTDAFALIRVLKRQHHSQPIYVLVNMAMNYTNSMDVFKRFEAATQKYLHVNVHYLGYIPDDANVKQSVASQTPVTLKNPDSLASRCFGTLAEVLGKQLKNSANPYSFSNFWKKQATATPPPPPKGSETQITSSAEKDSDPVENVDRLIHGVFRDQSFTKDQARGLFLSFLNAYAQRFNEPLLDPQTLTQHFASQREIPETAFRDTIFSLESLFEKHFCHPLRSIENRIMKIVADIDGSHELCGDFIRQLKENFGAQLYCEMLRSPAEFNRAIRNEHLDRETLAVLMNSIKAVNEERFGSAHSAEINNELEHLKELVKRLDQQESMLDNSLLDLHQYIDQHLIDSETGEN